MIRHFVPLFLALAPLASAVAPLRYEEMERDAIRRVALDYIDGLYAHDVDRVRRTLSPNLPLRENTESLLKLMDGKKAVARDGKLRGVLIFDRYGDAAVVRADLTSWISYLQMIRSKNHWLISSILMTPRSVAGPLLPDDSNWAPMLPDWVGNPLTGARNGSPQHVR